LSGDTTDIAVSFEDIASQVADELKKGQTGVLAMAKKFSRATGMSKNKLYEKILAMQLGMEKKPDLETTASEKGENTNG